MILRVRPRQHLVTGTRWARIVLVVPGREITLGSVRGTSYPDLVVVDALARLQLLTSGTTGSIELRDVAVELAELLDLVGIGDLMAGAGYLQARGEAEGGEQVGVEEEVHPGDPIA